jgi:hypothetical protein
MKRIKRLVVPSGTYMKDGQEKTSWLNIGHILSDGAGKTKIKFDCMPVGEWDGWTQVFDVDDEKRPGAAPAAAPVMDTKEDLPF